MFISVLRSSEAHWKQAPRLGFAQTHDAMASEDAAQALDAVERQRLAVAEAALRARIQVGARQPREQAFQGNEPPHALGFRRVLQGFQGHAVLDAKPARARATQ